MFSVGERVEVLRRGAGNGALLQFVPLQESEEELGDAPCLSALFSACTLTDAYSVVSVRDFLVYLELEFRSQVTISVLYSLMCILNE